MSIAYLDPGNIESDLQSGAKAGFKVGPQVLIIFMFDVLPIKNQRLVTFPKTQGDLLCQIVVALNPEDIQFEIKERKSARPHNWK